MSNKKEQIISGRGITTVPTQEHHIYFEWYLNERAGGPPGYLANLCCGLNQTDNYDKPLIVFNTYKGSQPPKSAEVKKGLKEIVKKMILAVPGGKYIFVNYLSRGMRRTYSNLYNFLHNLDAIMPSDEMMQAIDWTHTRTIHVHTAAEVVKVKNYLRSHFMDDVKVILTCHTPESVANEQYALSRADGYKEDWARVIQAKWLELEKRAYREADIMIFPSEEAKEPLMHDIPEFADIIADKDVRYLATGSKCLIPTLTREEAKEKYGVSGKTVIGYIGRHNSIKGYDLLKEAAKIVFQKSSDVVFLIGGSQGSEFAPLQDSRWIEAGWINPADMLRALDVFALPNRQTYYDLVLLEVLSMGVPVVATATGGNKSVKKIAEDLELCDVSAESLADAILKLVEMEAAEREAKGCRLQEVYQNYFTEKHMAQRYVQTIRQIYDDYQLWNTEEKAE